MRRFGVGGRYRWKPMAPAMFRQVKYFDIPVLGTHAHALVEFMAMITGLSRLMQALIGIVCCLVDTYDTLRIGVPTAIRVARNLGIKSISWACRSILGLALYFQKVRRQFR